MALTQTGRSDSGSGAAPACAWGAPQQPCRALVLDRCGDEPDLPAAAFTSDDSRPGFVRLGFLPILRCTLWVVP